MTAVVSIRLRYFLTQAEACGDVVLRQGAYTEKPMSVQPPTARLSMGGHCVTIELESNLPLVERLLRPSANLTVVRVSSINGEFNFREREKTGFFQFHIVCREFILSWGANIDKPISVQSSTVGRSMRGYVYLIRVDPSVPRGLHLLTLWWTNQLNV